MKWHILLLLAGLNLGLVSCVTETKLTRSPVVKVKGNKLADSGPDDKDRLEALLKQYQENPNDAGVIWHIGVQYYKRKKYRRAEVWFKDSVKAIQKKHTNAETKFSGMFYFYYYIAQALLNQSNREAEAIEYFKKTLSVKQNQERFYLEYKQYRLSHFHLALVYSLKNKKRLADTHFASYLKLGGNQDRVKRTKFRIAQLNRVNSLEKNKKKNR